MAQITSGIRSILSNPFVYSSLQSLMGASKSRIDFVENHIKPLPGMKILDIGCGPADILAYLPDVDYWGFDISEAYILQAEKKFGNRGRFRCEQLSAEDLAVMPKFDVVLALGLLHHMDDLNAQILIKICYEALKPGGKLFTIDPCFDSSQNLLARLLILSDRGQNVRSKSEYEILVGKIFSSPAVQVRHQTWIPYTHCYMECNK